MKFVGDCGPEGQIRLSLRSWESGGMGFREQHETEVLMVRDGNIVLRKSSSEGRVLETQVQVADYEYEISPSQLVSLIKAHGVKRP